MAKKVKLQSSRKTKSRQSIARESKSRIATRSKRSHSKHQRDEISRKIAKIFLIFVAVVLIAMLGGSIYAFSWLQGLNDNLPTVDAVFPDAPISSVIFDRNGQQLYKVIGDVNSDPVDIKDIPERVKWPFLAAEDEDFYTHDGFDTAGILRCTVSIAKSAGGDLCGASTITQQLIKITALNDVESKVERKIQELFMATKVEQANTKDEILQMYLTVTSYGSNIVGINSASKFYFGKDPGELTLAQASILSSIVQNPAYLSPTQPFDGDTERAQTRLKARQMYVLGQMRENLQKINNQIIENERVRAERDGREFNLDEVELFTEEMIASAETEEITYRPPLATDIKAGHFVNFVISQLQEKNYKNDEEPFTLEDLHNGGYRIYTTLDYELQKTAEYYANLAGNQYDYWNVHNAAVMTIQPKTGQILTMAGSKQFFGESEGCDENGANCLYNPEVNVLATLQSPGSTNKVLDYYLAFDQGVVYPGDLLPDVPISIGGYNPKNWDSGYKGVENTVRDMLRTSRNIPALILIEAVGVEKYVETAQKLGYTTYDDPTQFGHSVALGGTSVYPYEHAAAFSAFANGGDFVPAESILRIEDSNGNVVYESNPEPEQVLSPQGVFLINQTLYNLENLSWDGRDIAAKTGTSESNIDSSMVVWSPDFVTFGWVGNNNNDPTDPFNGYASIVVKPWLAQYLKDIGGSEYFSAKTPFSRPGYVYRGGGGCVDGECLGLASDWMIEGKGYTSRIKQQEVTVCKDQPDRLARDIDIALGMSEKKTIKEYKMPASTWQGFLDNFVKSKGGGVVPTEYCDIDRGDLSKGPLIRYGSISSPDSSTLNVSMKVYDVGDDIRNVKIEMNGQTLKTINNGFPDINESLDISALGYSNGERYTVKIIALDKAGESSTFVDSVIIGAGPQVVDVGSVSFSALPNNQLTFGTDIGNGVSQNITASYSGTLFVQNAKLFQTDQQTGQTTLVGDMSDIGSDSFSISWGANIGSNPTSYTFYVEATLSDGSVINSGASGAVSIVN